MPDIAVFFGKAAGVLSLAAYLPYIFSILKRRIKPNRATWIIWATVSASVFASSRATGAEATLWMLGSYMLGSSLTALLSLKYGEGGWTSFDRRCLLGAGIGLFLWWLFDSPLLALVICTFVDCVGALPTIRKAYFKPEGESCLAWALFFLGSTLNLFALKKLEFAIVFYPMAIGALNALITALLFWPRKKNFILEDKS